MIGPIVPFYSRIRRSHQSNDITDRLNYQYSALLLCVCAATLVATQYVGKPIQCWVPPEWTGVWERYTETICFISGSYFLPDDQLASSHRNPDHNVGYYQWVPLVLVLQALLFHFPSIVWRAFNFNTGIDVKALLECSAKIKKKVDIASRTQLVKAAATHVAEALATQRESNVGKLDLKRRLRGSGFYLCGLYLITKILYVLNIMIQFAIFRILLDTKSSFWGFEVMSDLLAGREWQETGNFPRVTVCDFHVRILGNVQRHTVQCVLMINMYTEKIYVFLWFWTVFVLILSMLSMTYWFLALSLPDSHRDFIYKYLECYEAISFEGSESEDRSVTQFVHEFLNYDGVFLCRLIQNKGGDLLAGEVITELYDMFIEMNEEETSSTTSETPDSAEMLPR